MCKCERQRLAKLLAAGNDLVTSIKNAAWGTVRHPTLHMEAAITEWEAQLKRLEDRQK